jgi:two-component system, LytTR family, response regulator
MNINCLIIDDEPLAMAVIENYVQKIPYLHLIDKFDNPIDAYEILQKENIDLIFLDIEMPNLTGIDFLKTLSKPPKVIIISANKEYAIEGFELNVLDYVIKPITFERFLKAINKFPEDKQPEIPHTEETEAAIVETVKDDFLFVKENKKMVKVYLNNILYLESIKDYVKIFTTRKSVITKQQLSFFEDKLQPYEFLRVHRSLLVSIRKIDAFGATSVEIDKKEFPIGRSYKEQVLDTLNKKLNIS